MTKNKYRSLPSRRHLKALILLRDYWDMFSVQGTQPAGIRTKTGQVLVFKNKMELHIVIARTKKNIQRMMNIE